MLHDKLLERLRKERRDQDGFIKPDYGHASLAEVAPTAEAFFGLSPTRPTLPREMWERYRGRKRVVFLLLDGFPYDHFARYASQYPLMSRMVERGDIYPITSVFPSTTPSALTTLHSGLTPQEHGLPEWTVFFDELDLVIETLPFRALMTHGRDTLLGSGGLASMLFSEKSVYQRLADHGVPSYVFTYHEYASSAYSMSTQRGARVMPYTDATDLFGSMRSLLSREDSWGYWFVYWGSIDSVMHQYGPHTPEHLAAIETLMGGLEREVFSRVPRKQVDDTLFWASADHGHTPVRSDKIIYLDQYRDLETMYAHDKKGRRIPPTGGPQDVFLFIEPSKLTSAITLLERELGDRARVMRTEAAIADGYFGVERPSERFLRRVGNVLVLPKRDSHVWYRFTPGGDFGQRGCHGGLSELEMVVPFAVCPMEHLLTTA